MEKQNEGTMSSLRNRNLNNPRYRKAMEEAQRKQDKKIALITCGVIICIFASLALIINLMNGENEMSNYQFEAPKVGDTVATIKTTMGDIKVKLFKEHAPKAVENFTKHADFGYYDDVIFHRVMEDFMIQTGDPTGTGYEGESIWGTEFEDELTEELSLFTGALAMANRGPNTNGSQFFIVQAGEVDDYLLDQLKQIGVSNKIINSYKEHGGTPHLDYRFTSNRHTVFGQVYEGMDVVNSIAKVPTDDNDKPIDEIKIIDISVKEIEDVEE